MLNAAPIAPHRGIRIKLESPEVKKELAQKSVEYNKKHYEYISNLFEDFKQSDIGSKLRFFSSDG